MFDSGNSGTFAAINELCALAEKKQKPICFWIGAGASAWCRLPLWPKLAEVFHKDYVRFEASYDKLRSIALIEQSRFPEFFGSCKQTNATRFKHLLVSSLKAPPQPPPVFLRFTSALLALNQPLQILTTNVDEALEHSLHVQAILPSNIERLRGLLHQREPFIAKLHGSVSAVESTVFTAEEYAATIANPNYIESLKAVFESSCVVFIG